MVYTVFIYENDVAASQKSFASQVSANVYIKELEGNPTVQHVLLDDGQKILAELKRDADGNLSSAQPTPPKPITP